MEEENWAALDIEPPWRQAVEDVENTFGYGSLVTKDWLVEAFRLKHPATVEEKEEFDLNFMHSMSQMRSLLSEKYLKELKPNHDKTWTVLKPQDQTEYALDSMHNEIKRTLKRGKRQLSNVNRGMLNDEQRRHNSHALGVLAGIAAFTRDAKRLPNKS